MSLKVIIRSPNHLGDCLMALPMINETREAYPGASVTLLVPEPLAGLFENNPAIDKLLTIPSRQVHGLIAVMKIKDIIAPHNFDVGYILPPSFGAAAGFKLAGVPERIGYVADGRRLLLSRPLPLPAPINSAHRSELYFNLLRRGAGVQLEYVRPKLFLNDEDSCKGQEILASFGIEPGERYAAIAFRAVAESRRWGKQNYIELIKEIIAQYHMKVVLTGSADDQREGQDIASAAGTKKVVNLAGRISLREAAAILSGAVFFAGNDSGGAHLAAVVGIPIVVLSGADDPSATSPLSSSKRLIYLEHLDCISCVKNVCPLKGEDHMRCMKEISVPMVLQSINDLVGV
ncbi:MAG: lipopolysaccharide heptosyltransferase II [candidate division Zixibacteria bacterium]|nr:lipopolysaccharide heptosyltransferase II [candidate division Zixibacteria bacterium]